MESEEPQHCVQEFYKCRNLGGLQKVLQSADQKWMEEFIEHGGLGAILNCLAALGGEQVDSAGDDVPRLECVGCLKAVMNSRYGLECVIRRGGAEGSFVSKIALQLDTDSILLKIHLFLVLSALSKHSPEGLKATLEALDYYKRKTCQRHRYSILVQELSQTGQYPEYQGTIMAFINYLLSSCGGLMERMRLRSELNALDFADVLSFIKCSDSPALLQQVQLYKASLLRDQEESTMPGGVDITDHQQLFTALLEKVYATPNSTKLLTILQRMLLIDRDTLVSDITWSALERMADSALKISSDQQAERVCTSEIDRLHKALEDEAARKQRGEGEGGGGEGESHEKQGGQQSTEVHTSSSTQVQPSSAPPPGPPPGPPPPPPPEFGKKKVFEIRSIFDRARFYEPKKRMKKLNWEKASDHEAKLSAALWHRASQVDVRVCVTVSEKHIETLFCQKMDTTDGRFSGKSKKTHLPDQKKALNVNIVLDGMKKFEPDPNNPSVMRRVHLNDGELVAVIRDGLTDMLSLNQANLLMEQSPNEKDVAFLEQYKSNPGQLGRVERYMLGLVQLPAYPVRLRLLRTRKVFEDLEEEYCPTFDLLHRAMDELMKSESLRNLFYIILLIGNFINGNTKLGSAYGFKVTSLQRLSNTLANVKKTTLNVNFLHYLVTVCEDSEEASNLLDFHMDLPSLDRASRVSVETIQEELNEWKKEVEELKEMTSSEEQVLPSDLASQIGDFVPTAEGTLGNLFNGLEKVRALGRKMAEYLCDDRQDFLELVFTEIKNFVIEFTATVKETVKEKPIWFTPEPSLEEQSQTPPQPPTRALETPRRGLSRATSIITEHRMDLPPSLPPISEEQLTQRMKASNPFVFPTGQVRADDGMNGEGVGIPLSLAVPAAADIVFTDLEEADGGEMTEGKGAGVSITPQTTPQGTENGVPPALFRRPLAGRQTSQAPRSRRHSSNELGRPVFSALSRQVSWNDYKAMSAVPHARGVVGGVKSYPSVDPHTIFGGSLDDVAKLLHKMAEAIERDIAN